MCERTTSRTTHSEHGETGQVVLFCSKEPENRTHSIPPSSNPLQPAHHHDGTEPGSPSNCCSPAGLTRSAPKPSVLMRLSASPRKSHTMHALAGDGFDWALGPAPSNMGTPARGMVDANAFGPSVNMRRLIRGRGCRHRCCETSERHENLVDALPHPHCAFSTSAQVTVDSATGIDKIDKPPPWSLP